MASAAAAAAAATAGGRGACSMNSMYFKPMLRKAYHRKPGSSDTLTDHTVKLNGEEATKHKPAIKTSGTTTWWVRDDRTGIYYPKGHEKVIEDVPPTAGKDFGVINWFG